MPEYIIESGYDGKLVAAEKLTRCRDCVNWQAPIAYTSTGKCKLHDRICNKNYFCADGREKDG